MPRPNTVWFRTSKNTWYVHCDGRAVSLRIKGRKNRKAAIDVWHRRKASGISAGPVVGIVTTGALIDAYLQDVAVRVQPITLSFYQRFLEPFRSQFGSRSVDQLTPSIVMSWAAKPTWSNSSRHNALSALATVMRWAVRSRMIAINPLLGMRLPPKESAGAGTVLSADTFAKIMEITSKDKDFNALLRFLWLTGCRPSEAAGLTFPMIDQTAAVARLRTHKTAHTGQSRLIYLPPEAITVLGRQHQRHGGDGYAFRNQRGQPFDRMAIVKRLWRIKDTHGIHVTAYGFRHTFATDALSRGVPDAHVAALLGHSSTAMLHKHYSHLTARADVLRAAVRIVR